MGVAVPARSDAASSAGHLAGVKFVGRDTFRAVDGPVGYSAGVVMIGVVFTSDGASWHVVGKAPHPHRPGDSLVFVKLVWPPNGP